MRKARVAVAMLALFAARPVFAAEVTVPAAVPAAVTGSSGGVTLSEAVVRALARNPSVKIANQELDRARALLIEARAPSMPTLTGNALYTRLDGERVLGTRVIAGQDSLGANLNLSMPLFAPARWRNWGHAEDGVAVAAASAEETRRQIGLFAGRAWLQVAAQANIVAADLRAQSAAKAHFDYARTRLGGGLGNRVDVVRAEQALANATAFLESARTGLAKAREALGVLLGADGPVDISSGQVPEPGSLEEALGGTARRRADLRALDIRRTLAKSVAHDAWTDYTPLITGAFAPFYQNPPSLTQPRTGWQAQVILSWPLYDGGFRYGLEREHRDLSREATLSFEGAVRQARSDVRGGYEAVGHADASLSAARDAARLAHEGLDLATLAYRNGATTNLEVIDAERTALDADTAAAVAEDAARQARLELLAASGSFP